MKKILSILSVAAVLTACSTNNDTAALNAKMEAYKDSLRLAADTAGLSEYQQWKAQNEIQDDYNQAAQYAAVAPAAGVTRSYAPARKSSAVRSRSRSTGYSSGSSNSESSHAAKTVRKKGWSKAAKGAAIGAGSGAVLGAVINKKNRVVGGVVGGVLGGGIGYGIGRGMDKRDGRY